MSGVPCTVGCMRRGEHFAACDFYEGGTCRGCVPRDAAEGSLICGRCFGRTRALLEAVPDLLGHLRSLIDPLKATRYDKEPGQVARLHAPPPVPVEVLDAADYLVTLLWATREVVEGRTPVGRVLVPAGADAPGLVGWAVETLEPILDGLHGLSQRPEVVQLVRAVKGRPPSRDEWTVRTIAERYTLTEPPWWAAQPCPLCGLRAIKVTPPATPGDDTTYKCHAPACGWVAPEDVDGFWAEAFSRREGQAA